MYITGANFDWDQWNISRDILDFVIYILIIGDVINYPGKTWMSLDEKRPLKKNAPFLQKL